MKKIMYILNTGKYSGAENVIIQIIKNLDRDKFYGIYVSLDGPIREYLAEYEIPFYPIEKLNVKNLIKCIKKIRPDIIHANDFKATVCAAFCHGKIPLISHIHNNDPCLKKVNLKSIAYLMSTFACETILTVSPSIEEECIFRGFIKNKIINIGNPVDIEKIRSSKKKIQKIKYDIIFLGRFSPPKKPLYAIKIMKAVNEKLPVKCVMVGDGELRTQCEEYIRDNKLAKIIDIVGFQKNPYDFLAQSKILLMPSEWEGFGLAAAEALALGKPVVCSDVGGLREIVDSSCGKLCKKSEDFIEFISLVLEDEDILRKLSIGANKKINNIETVDQYTNKISHIYSEIISN